MQIDSKPPAQNDNGHYQTTQIPAFTDNYLRLLDNAQSAIVKDSGDAQAIIDQLDARAPSPDYILTTHHHPDYITSSVDEPTVFAYPALYCSESFFAGGCGRGLSGRGLFGRGLEDSLQQRVKELATLLATLRANHQANVASTLATELATNPFLRYDADELITTAITRKKNISAKH